MNVLPAVVIIGSDQLSGPLSQALRKTKLIPAVHNADSVMGLMDLQADLPEGRLVYLFSPSAEVDMEGIELSGVADQIRGNGHVVMAIGGDPKGEAFGKEVGLTILRPGANLGKAIAEECGIKLPEPQRPAATPAQQQRPAQRPAQPKPEAARPAVAPVDDETRNGMRTSLKWRQAADTRESLGSRELAPLEGAKDAWNGAVDLSRRAGALQPGHRARGYVLSIASRKGGVGKSTLAVNSAAYLARALRAVDPSKRVVLLDLNLQQSDIGNYIHKHEPNVVDLVRNPNLLSSERIEDALVYSEKHKFHALLGPSSIAEANPHQIHIDVYRQIIDLLRARFDYILIDTPVAEHYHEALRLALPMSNYVIVPIAPARVTLDDISAWLSQITAGRHANGYGIDHRRIGLVLNRAKVGIGMDPPDVEDRLSGWKFIGMFPDSDDWQLAENTGGLIGSSPPAELEAVFKHMLFEATNDPALNPTRPAAGNASGKKRPAKRGSWLKRLLGG